MVRAAIVGIGGYGWELIGKLREAEIQLVAAADSNLEELFEQADDLRKSNVELFSDAVTMFEAVRRRCDAVYIASSIHTHTPLTIAAAETGYHVHLEKPPAATIQDLDQMLAVLEAHQRMCLVGFQAIHADDIQFLKDRVVSGRLGRLQWLTCCAGWPRNRAYYLRNTWAGELRVGNRWVLDGPATNALSHQLMNMLLLASDQPGRFATPTSVRAELYAAGPVTSHDTAAIEVRTAEGPSIILLVSHCTQENFGPLIELEAERARVRWQMGKGATINYHDGSTENASPDPDSGRKKMILNFIQALRQNDPALLRCPLGATRGFVLALDGAHESSVRVRRIPPDQISRVGEGEEARTVVAGLDEALKRAAEARCLLSDLPDAPPWAVATQHFDLARYSRFPQRFIPG